MRILLLFSLLCLQACMPSQSSRPSVEADKQLSRADQLLHEGQIALQGNAKRAIEQYFDVVIRDCAAVYNDEKQKAYASRSLTETIYYMTRAASEGRDAITVAPTCADALFLKGYASLDLGEVEIATEHIQRAIDMSPVNARYLSEMGHLYQLDEDWPQALEMFSRAEQAAQTFSPEQLKNIELARAKRGVGYSLIELGRLDEAENKFRECLQLDANDQSALGELRYIDSLREIGRQSPEAEPRSRPDQ